VLFLCVLCALGGFPEKSWRRLALVFGLRDEVLATPLVLKETSHDYPNHPDETETGM
jgi:hypothetical protein